MAIVGRNLLTVLLLAFSFSSSSYALIQGQILLGQRSAPVDFTGSSEEDFSGINTKISAYLDPIPLIPIGFGLSLSNVDFGEAGVTDSLKGQELSLDVMAWIPLPLSISPYIKLAYILSGEYKAEVSGVESTYDSKGTRVAIGAKYSLLPLMSLLFEVEQSQVSLEPDSGSDVDAKGLGILIGASLGI